MKVKQSDKSLPLANQKLEMTPIQNKTNVDIVHWHGIPACDIDSVFEYKGKCKSDIIGNIIETFL